MWKQIGQVRRVGSFVCLVTTTACNSSQCKFVFSVGEKRGLTDLITSLKRIPLFIPRRVINCAAYISPITYLICKVAVSVYQDFKVLALTYPICLINIKSIGTLSMVLQTDRHTTSIKFILRLVFDRSATDTDHISIRHCPKVQRGDDK
jgi:hypothetical protein